MKKKQISKLYTQIYNEMGRLLKIYNPCKFDSTNGTCLALRNHNILNSWRIPFVLCCRSCAEEGRNKHSRKSGCRINSLGCKLYICSEIEDQHEEYKQFFIERERLLRKVHRLLPTYPSAFTGKTRYLSKIKISSITV